MACAIILNATYSIHAWFSGGLPYFLMKFATKTLEAGTSRVWYQTVGQVPLRLPSPAAQASAVLRLKPTIGQGRPNSAYCLISVVTWLPARLEQTTSGLACRTFNKYGLKSVTSVPISSS